MYLNLDPAFQIKLLVQVKKVEAFTWFDADFFKRKSMPFCLFDSLGTLLVIDYILVNFELPMHCTTTFAKDSRLHVNQHHVID